MVKNDKPKTTLEYSVVLVEYFSSDHIVRCLESIYLQTKLPEKIVVVVNGIEDSFRKKISNNFKDVVLIDPGNNLGYSKAANLGIANTDSPIVLTLNPDTELKSDAAELSCLYLAEHDLVGALGPQILDCDFNIYPSARTEPSLLDSVGHGLLGAFFPNNRFTRRYKNLDTDENQTRRTDWLSGAALFLRRQALDEIGGWDEDYFMYCEDIDLGNKLRNNRWENIYFPKAQITHIQGVSTSRTPVKLLVEHHKSLYIYSNKKYNNNLMMKIFVAVFISIRFPLALIAHKLRLN